MYVYRALSWFTIFYSLCIFKQKNPQHCREIYFDLKKYLKIINPLQLLNTVCSYLHWSFVCLVIWAESIFLSFVDIK